VFSVLDGMDVGQLGSVFSAAKFVSKPITFQKCTPSSSFVFVFDPGVFDPLTPRAVLLKEIVVGICFSPFQGERPTIHNPSRHGRGRSSVGK
jgi:hypothetical protein